MTTAITWVMSDEFRPCRYILLDHVLVAVDGSAEFAVAHAFASRDLAHEAAVMHTKSDEVVGYRLRGDIVMIETNVSPSKIAEKYRTEQPLGAGLRTIMQRVYKGRGMVLT